MHFKSLMRNLNVMNAALLAGVVLFAVYEFPFIFRVPPKYTPPSASKPAEKDDKTAEVQPLPPSEYTAIAEQNIFHPERKIPEITIVAPPLPKPDFVLYGTLLAGDVNLAYIEDLKGASAGGKRQRALKKGEILSGFTLKDIETDKIIMVRGEETLEVRVTDKKRPGSTGSNGSTAGQASPRVSPSGARQPSQRQVQPDVQSVQRRTDEEAKKQMKEAAKMNKLRPRVRGAQPIPPQNAAQ